MSNWLTLGSGINFVYAKSTTTSDPVGDWESGKYVEIHFGASIAYFLSQTWNIQAFITEHLPDLRSPWKNNYLQLGVVFNKYF